MANFVVSGTPHVRSKESIQSIMRDVVIALVPATIMGIIAETCSHFSPCK